MKIERKEKLGIITSYDVEKRAMTILNSCKKPLERKFSQALIENPTRITLEIESYCSSQCKYCSEGSKPGSIQISKEKVFELIDEAEKMKVHEITIRGGEATLHPDFNEIWEYASGKKSMAVNVITNGMQFDAEKVKSMLKNKKTMIIVSLDGFKEINSFHRNPEQYDKVMVWLPEIAKEFREQITILSCLYKQNAEGIIPFAEHLARMGIGHYHITPLKRLGRSEMVEENFVSLTEIEKIQKAVDSIAEKYPHFKPAISCIALDKYKQNKTNNISVPLFNEIHYGTSIKITPEGEVLVNRGIMFTEKFKEKSAEEIYLEPLGSIYDGRNLKKIWNESSELRKMQEKIADKNYFYYLGWLKQLS
jgi:MoaA/NifB/PqqE/SkfB family radical SAM enzyme